MANKAVLVTLPGALLEGIDSLVNTGYYSSRSDMIREVIREKVALAILKSHKGAMKGKPKKIDKDKLLVDYLKKEGLSWPEQ